VPFVDEKMLTHLHLPRLSWRFIPVWQRNYLVWKKLAIPSILGNLADPMLYMLGLGYGLGSLLPDVDGMPYLTFLAAGTVAYSTMNAATFEVLYSSFSRMHVQRTWDAILNAPMTLDDVMLGELSWAMAKSLLSGLAILAVIWGLGLFGSFWMTLWIVPVVVLVGFCFGGMGLVMNAVSPSYDFFLYYFTLVITPMVLLCGVFFPVSQLPELLQGVSAWLPLTHAVDLARPLVLGKDSRRHRPARRRPDRLRCDRLRAGAGAHPPTPAEIGNRMEKTLDVRIDELEAKLAFAEDMIESLNLTVFRQQEQLDLMQKQIRLLHEQLKAVSPKEERDLRDEIPPHY
jgi:lipooligosaccharide transport system permease protein